LSLTPPEGSDGPLRHEGHVFVSYAAEDRELAAGIASYLESCGWNVWWDREIPVGRRFDEVIEDALRGARCVIVLWTKAAVSSRWVRSEASDAAQREVLLPVLLEDATIPLEFRLFQTLDLRGWRPHAGTAALEPLYDSVARVSGGAPPNLASKRTQTTPRSEQPPAIWFPLLGLALLIALVAPGVWYWDAFYREIAEYYANVTTRWGFPEGVGRLTGQQVARRNASVVLMKRGRRNPPYEVRVVNSEGLTPPLGASLPITSMLALNPLPTGDLENPLSSELIQLTRVTLSLDSRGRLLEQAGFNRGGRRLYTLHFAEPDLGEYKARGFGTAVRESGIRYLRFSRVAKGPLAGLDESVEYLDDKRRPQADENGAFGYRLELNSSGLVAEWVNRGPDGADHATNHGVLKEIRTYDAFGNILEAKTVDASGAATASRLGPAVTRMRYDESGNVTRMSFFDEKERALVVQQWGASSTGFTYDRRGNLTSQTFSGPYQAMVVGPQGFAKQTIEWQTPTRFLARFYGVKEQPIAAYAGAFEVLVTVESRGYPVEQTYRDIKGNPTRSGEGCATVRTEYNDVGNLRSVKCLNEQGAPTVSTDGSSSTTFEYDDLGVRVAWSEYDSQGKPGLLGNTYATTRLTFTTSGLVETETYFDPHNAPVRNRRGFAKVAYSYDTSGNRVFTEYLDERGRRTTTIDGYSAVRRKFDERRLEIETAYLEATGKPTLGPDGYAIARYEHERRGFLSRIVQLGVDGKPTRGFFGYCSARNTWDDAGHRLEMTFFDERGASAVNTRFGSWKRQWTYDESTGLIAKHSDYGANGQAIMNAYGYSSLRYKYDEHGRETDRELLDTEGRAIEFAVVVDRVAGGSVASDAGLHVGDIILDYDGLPVRTSHQFTNTLELFRGDRRRELRIERGQQLVSLDIPPGHLQGLELVERARVAGVSRRK